MGLGCSGSIADAALYIRAEKDILHRAEELGVAGYMRFKDDAFAVYSCRDGVRTIHKQMQHHGKPFEIYVEEIGRADFEFCE